MIPLYNWRGCLVSEDMVDPLNELAASVKPLVKPIPGYGSYRTNAASGGTDSGSGHVDIYGGTGWTDEDRELFVVNGRKIGFETFFRPKRWYSEIRGRWLEENWALHFHLILKDSADLSDDAKRQLSQWYGGSNGLAGILKDGKWIYDPDPHPRTHLRQTWRQYLELKEEDMDWNDVLTYSKGTSLYAQFPNGFTARGLLGYAALNMFKSDRNFAELKAQNVALTAAVKALANSESVDLDAITAAAREGAKIDVELLAAALATQLDQVNEADIDSALRKIFLDAGTA